MHAHTCMWYVFIPCTYTYSYGISVCVEMLTVWQVLAEDTLFHQMDLVTQAWVEEVVHEDCRLWVHLDVCRVVVHLQDVCLV